MKVIKMYLAEIKKKKPFITHEVPIVNLYTIDLPLQSWLR